MPFNTRAGRHRHCYVVAKGGDRHVTRPTKGLSLSRLARTRSNRPLSRSASIAASFSLSLWPPFLEVLRQVRRAEPKVAPALLEQLVLSLLSPRGAAQADSPARKAKRIAATYW